MALAAFLRLAEHPEQADPATPLGAAVEAAYDLGRGEARAGRTADALLAAYRVGARVSWREMARTVVAGGLDAGTVAQFAELVFAYIDELSAASVAGHRDETATTGRVRERYLQQLGQALLSGEPEDRLVARAERADWTPPLTLTAVLSPEARAHGTASLLDPRTLVVSADGPALPADTTVLLVPDAGPGRAALLAAMRDRAVVVGPTRPWTLAAASYRRAVRALGQLPPPAGDPVDTEEHLAALVLGADPEALADLRERVLAPMGDLRPASAERLAETLRSWVLHQGRRESVAADLVVHPQTVRYRMAQLRELYGERLQDPDLLLELTVALGLPARSP
jgi:hypothetical protein